MYSPFDNYCNLRMYEKSSDGCKTCPVAKKTSLRGSDASPIAGQSAGNLAGHVGLQNM